jgi:hypothetical protein
MHDLNHSAMSAHAHARWRHETEGRASVPLRRARAAGATATRAVSSLRSGLALGTWSPHPLGAVGPWTLRAQLGEPASK